MMKKDRTSPRSQIAIAAYLVGYEECDGWQPKSVIDRHGLCYVKRTQESPPSRALVGMMLSTYRQGWRDSAAGKPCHPWIPARSN